MADAGEQQVIDTQSSKRWLNFFSSKSEGKKEFKAYETLFSNLKNWSNPSSTFERPFNSWRKKAVQNQIEEILDSYHRKGIQLTDAKTISFVNMLPLSKNRIAVGVLDGDFTMDADHFDHSKYGFFSLYGDLTQKISSFRNGKKTADRMTLTYKQLEFFFTVTKIVQHFSRQLYRNRETMSAGNDSQLAFRIDRNLFRLLLSLETLNPHVVAKELFTFIQSLVDNLYQLEILFFGLGVPINKLHSLSELKDVTLELRDSLHYAHTTQISSDGRIKDKSERETPAQEAGKFLSLLTGNQIGINISSTPPETANILRSLNYKDQSLTVNSSEFEILESWVFNLYSRCMYLIANPSQTNLTSEEEVVIGKDFIFNLLTELLSSTDINPEGYLRVQNRASHLNKTLKKKKQIDTVDEIASLIAKCLDVLRRREHEKLAILVGCLRNSPSKLDERLAILEAEFDVNAKWKQEIRTFELKIDSSIKEDSSLGSQLLNLGIEPQELHKELAKSIQPVIKARQRFIKLQNSLQTNNNMTAHVADKEKSKLIRYQNDFRDAYFVEKDKLISEVQNPESDKRELLYNFGNRIKTITDEFFDEISRADAEAIISHSNAPGALMIGLGQGGEQIVRAAMAKMLNNNNDTRCRNLLKGLNVDIEKLTSLLKNKKKSFEIAINTSGKDNFNEITEVFDHANLLAINAGPEQKAMLSQPYNYIWGTSGGENTKFDQKKDNFIKQSTNAILLDVGKKGSGGKMGKGRAYAVNAEAAISDTFRQKQEGKNIRQVCVVHSFAGGSGSGMILPVLRMIKQNLPGAMVWVFSAGETAEGGSTHDAENVVYITSDILQARYNALHYKEKEITLKEWTKFSEEAGLMFNELKNEWQKIAPHLPDLHEDDYEDFIQETRDRIKEKIVNSEQKYKAFFTLKKPEKDIDNPFELIADTPELQQLFYKSASNTKTATDLTDIWRLFNDLIEDSGSYSLKPLVLRSSSGDLPGYEGTVGYVTQFSHLKYICMGLRARVDSANQNQDEARDKINKEYEGKNEIHPYAMFGVEASINYDVEGISNEFDYEDLEKLLHDYANKMRNYHTLLSNKFEDIKLNLAAQDDPNIKHVIISNGHLDLAARDIVPNRTQNYEIYNSIMTDTFLNLVHSIVENNSNEEATDAANSITLGNEVMDLNDMSGRTNPTSNATLLSLPELLSTQNDIHFSKDDSRIISEDLAYRVFTKLFEDPFSPLMDSSTVGNYKFPGQPVMALFSNYLKDKRGLRKFKVTDVIHSVEEKDLQSLLVNNDDVKSFWQRILSTFDDEQKELLERQSDYQIDELVNTINWLKVINPVIISHVYGQDRAYFLENTKKWQADWSETFGNKDTNSNSCLNPTFRINAISNEIVRIIPDMDLRDRKTMSSLLFRIGIIDGSHLSAIPSSLIYDFAPNLLKDFTNPEISVVYTTSGGPEKPVVLTEEEVAGFLNPNQIPSYDIARTQYYAQWDQTRQALAEQKSEDTKFKFELLMKNRDESFSLTYLTIKTTIEDVTENQRCNIFAITPEFMSHFAIIKQACVNDYPEFANTTILNRLIVASPNIKSTSSKRTLEEKPLFRKASEDIETNSQPKMLHPEETETSMLFRTLLLGNMPDNHQQKVLYNTQIRFSDEEWYTKIRDSHDIDYGKLFDTLKFENSVKERIQKLRDQSSQSQIENHDKFNESISLNVLKFICLQLEGMDIKEMDSKSIFDDLFIKITKNSPEWIAEKDKLNKITLRKHIDDHLNLLSRLSSMSFAAHRQHRFAADSTSKEYGVAYEFEGTLDAIRSMPEDWLWLVNSSSTIEARLLERTLRFFSLNYLETPKNPKYKVFVQHLQNGPLAHLTLISQKAGFTEVSEKYSQLMRMLSEEKFGIIKGPYVHPYSFLRNILWLHTFKNMWVNASEKSFDSSMQIPPDVISNIFAKPHLIEVTEGSVMSSGDMKGINLSHYDTEMWRRAKETVWKEISETDDKHYQERMKNQIHIPDMLLINYLREKANESKGQMDFDSVYQDASSDEIDDLALVYPANMWKTKLDTLSLSQYIKAGETDSPPSSNLSRPALPGFKPQKPTSPKMKSEPWLNALKSWKKWYEEMKK